MSPAAVLQTFVLRVYLSYPFWHLTERNSDFIFATTNRRRLERGTAQKNEEVINHMAKKWVYAFTEGNADMRNLLGGKGANLAEMTNIGLPVPQGFTITTEACTQYYEDGRQINDEIMAQAMDGVKKMEEINGKKFGDLQNPLLVSVRSGARASMPGMMETILNLGLNDKVVAAMIAGNPDPKFKRFVYDSYRRFIQMFSDVVMGVGKK